MADQASPQVEGRTRQRRFLALLFILLMASILVFGLMRVSTISGRELAQSDPVDRPEVVVQEAAIHGLKWHDLSGDGIKDVGEPVLQGWEIYLVGDNGSRQRTR